MNTKFYIITLIISLLLMMPSCFISDCGWVNLLSSIGCSGFAAAVMAIFLEKNMEKRKERFKETYFYPLFNELTQFLERILWMFEHQDDLLIDWNQEPEFYYSQNFILLNGLNSVEIPYLSYEEAIVKLEDIMKKYVPTKIYDLAPDEIEKLHKKLVILYYGSFQLCSFAKNIQDNSLFLDREGYISIEEVKRLCFDIDFGTKMLKKKGANYYIAISSILGAYQRIRKLCGYTDPIRINWSFSLSLDQVLPDYEG